MGRGEVVKEYYDARAFEYDEWYEGTGVFASRERPSWDEAVRALEADLAELAPRRTLDVACGTGFLTRWLRGPVTGLDQSSRMLEIASQRVPGAGFVEGDALALPFADDAFERVLTAHFYGHLDEEERARFLGEAFRVAEELIVVDSALRPDHRDREIQTRVLNDGSRYEVLKRYFDVDRLLDELGSAGDRGRVIHASDWFVGVAVSRAGSQPVGSA